MWQCTPGGAFTSATDQPIESFSNIKSVTQVIDTIKSVLGTDLEPATIPKPDNFIEIPDQFLDSKKLHDFGFAPKIDFTEGVRRTIEWYAKHQDLLTKLGARYVLD